jgi:hypothetical protein
MLFVTFEDKYSQAPVESALAAILENPITSTICHVNSPPTSVVQII